MLELTFLNFSCVTCFKKICTLFKVALILVGSLCLVLVCDIVLCAPSSFLIISLGKEEVVALFKTHTSLVCVCFVCVMVSFPHSSMSRLMICDCRIYLFELTRFVA